jgi:hypothetical protein
MKKTKTDFLHVRIYGDTKRELLKRFKKEGYVSMASGIRHAIKDKYDVDIGFPLDECDTKE